MLNTGIKLNNFDFKQEPEIFAIFKQGNKIFCAPSIILGNFTVVFTDENSARPEIISFSVRERCVGNFNILPNSEALYYDAVNANLTNAFIAMVSNIFVASELRTYLGMADSTNGKGLQQQLVDFIAALCNMSAASGVHPALVAEEVRYFIGSVMTQTDSVTILYSLSPFITEGIKRFVDIHVKQEAESTVISEPNLFNDDDLDFLANVGM